MNILALIGYGILISWGLIAVLYYIEKLVKVFTSEKFWLVMFGLSVIVLCVVVTI